MTEHEYVCRCEEVTAEDVVNAIRLGDRSVDAIKKRTRAGMGYCQGKTCRTLIARILSRELKRPIEEFLNVSVRQPLCPVKLEVMAKTELPEESDGNVRREDA